MLVCLFQVYIEIHGEPPLPKVPIWQFPKHRHGKRQQNVKPTHLLSSTAVFFSLLTWCMMTLEMLNKLHCFCNWLGESSIQMSFNLGFSFLGKSMKKIWTNYILWFWLYMTIHQPGYLIFDDFCKMSINSSTKTKTVGVDVLHGVQHCARSPWQGRVKLFCIKRGDVIHRQCLWQIIWFDISTHSAYERFMMPLTTTTKYSCFQDASVFVCADC